MSTQYAIQMIGIDKTFPGVQANKSVDFNLIKGEIHALLGENGAGKTTLMSILSGLIRPDGGRILIDGKPAIIHSPKDAIEQGIGMVHQRPLLVNRLTVTENVLLGQSSKQWLTNTPEDTAHIKELCIQYGFQIDPQKEVWRLSAGEQQRVEILKALYRGVNVLILDEPTSVLTPQESELLFILLRSMAGQGISIVYISHKLEEVIALADQATVMRSGSVVGTVDIAATTIRDLACMMVGREVLFHLEKEPARLGETILEVKDIVVRDDMGQLAVSKSSFRVQCGEIFGIAGVSGSGQTELAEVLVGLRTPAGGEVKIAGQQVTSFSPRAMIEARVGYLPDNLLRDALADQLSLADNAILKEYRTHKAFRRGLFINESAIQSYVSEMVERYDIRAASLSLNVGSLSGGNLRRLVLARELSRDPLLLVACQPTSGLDVAATEFIHKQLLELRQKGRAVLLISDNLDEVMLLSDTIGVMHAGHIVAVMGGQNAQREDIGLLMGGASPEKSQ